MPPRATRPHTAAHQLLFAHFARVRGENGNKSYREIATAMNLSSTSKGRVSQLLNGKALPSDAEQARIFVEALGGSTEDVARALSLFPAARTSFKRDVVQRCPALPADGTASDAVWAVLRRHADPTVVAAITELTARPVVAEHAERLLDLIARLLGQDLERLSGPEAALLIVAAHQHAPTAGDPHPHRLPVSRLTWQGAGLGDAIRALCRSFELPLHELRGELFDPIPGLSADLRFCAVLLRIAELLDVHDGRPPVAVRRHLGWRSEQAKAHSGRLNVGGLSFAHERAAGYVVALSAEPDHPSAEHELRCYLDDVDAVLLQCAALQHQFQASRQRFALPGRISRDRIEPHGYKYGEFRFELDRTAVLELFMGEQLYGEPYVFIRELLQNAFDAVRLHRLLHGADELDRVAVTCWQDNSGYLWVRVDDDGIGMDEHALLNFFLRVGRSYYRSPELQAELLRRGKAGEQFRPISRFGIGVLSCFIVADRVEVSTRRRYPDDSVAAPLRLSLGRDEDFFVLREADMPVDPMPGATAEDRVAYRDRCGTSVAVRVDPLRARITVEGVDEALQRYLFCPPVPVTFNSAPIGLITEEFVQRPWLPVPRVVDVAAADRQFERRPGLSDYLGPLRIALVPLDLTRYSATPMLRGQLVSCQAVHDGKSDGLGERADLLVGIRFPAGDRASVEARQLLSSAVVDWRGEAGWMPYWRRTRDAQSGDVSVTVTRTVDRIAVARVIELLEEAGHRPSKSDATDDTMSAGELLHTLREMRESHKRTKPASQQNEDYTLTSQFTVGWAALRGPGGLESFPASERWCGHNGIAVPEELSERNRQRASGSFRLAPRRNRWEALCGVVALTDALRPDVSVARDEVQGVPFAIHSALQLAVRRALAAYDGGPFADMVPRNAVDNLIQVPPIGRFSVSALQDDLLAGGAWDAEPVIHAPGESLSVYQIRERVASGTPVEIWSPRCGDDWIESGEAEYVEEPPFTFSQVIAAALAHERLSLAAPPPVEPDDDEDEDEWWEYAHYLSVVDDRLPRRRPEENAFPPVTFLPCQEPTGRIRYTCGAWNIDHPVVVWLLDHVGVLQRELPVCYDQLRTVLATDADPDVDVDVDGEAALHELLEHIARFRPDLAPPLDR